ncbi:MAG: hypothetical protein H7Z43_14755 [Clostridia bacterium]|nr:hypothetical protein [Deltaproteobacteria bacterium]
MSDDELENEALPSVYTISKAGLLLAYARRQVPIEGGVIRRASSKVPIVCAGFPHGVIDCFDAKIATVIADYAATSESLDALLFSLKLDGYDVTEGESKPHAAKRRF